MKHNKPLLFTLPFLIFAASISHSLGLGDITVQSNLGEPFLATIKLLHSDDLSSDQIHIHHANTTIYKKSGIERKLQYNSLQFKRRKNTIIISTKKPIIEPYLNFVLEIKWPAGQLIKAFEVFIDPVNRNNNLI